MTPATVAYDDAGEQIVTAGFHKLRDGATVVAEAAGPGAAATAPAAGKG